MSQRFSEPPPPELLFLSQEVIWKPKLLYAAIYVGFTGNPVPYPNQGAGNAQKFPGRITVGNWIAPGQPTIHGRINDGDKGQGPSKETKFLPARPGIFIRAPRKWGIGPEQQSSRFSPRPECCAGAPQQKPRSRSGWGGPRTSKSTQSWPNVFFEIVTKTIVTTFMNGCLLNSPVSCPLPRACFHRKILPLRP